MLCKIVIFLTLSVICVSSQCDEGCKQLRQYMRVKRGKFYSSPHIRFYNTPPMPIPIKGPFSYTPPPFISNDAPSYLGSPPSYPGSPPSYPATRPYKVSKRPPVPNDGLGDDEINNLVKYLSKQDLDKILEFAQEKGQGYSKYKDAYNTNEYTRPYKRESRIVYKGNIHAKYEEPAPYKEDMKFVNYVTEPSNVKVFTAQEPSEPIRTIFKPSKRVPVDADSFSPSQTMPNEAENFSPSQNYGTSHPSDSFPGHKNYENEEAYVKVYSVEESQKPRPQIDAENYVSYQGIPMDTESISPSQTIGNFNGTISTPNNPYYTESNEEEKLPKPVNMREDDFEISYTKNVPNIVKAESSSYNVENFGDLPLMDYNSKLHDVSSYHVPHYTVTQPKPKPVASSPSISFPSTSYSSYSSSSTLLKPSPAAAAIKEPVYERAPSVSAAAEQSDAHLKAVKIWSHKSQGAAYTLHDDGSLTPERSRPKYG